MPRLRHLALLLLPLATVAQAQLVPTPSTSTAGTVTAANTFQTALSSNLSRKGCLIVNTGTATLLVAFGNAPTPATAIPLAAGQTASCNAGIIVVTDRVSVTSPTAGNAFLVIAE